MVDFTNRKTPNLIALHQHASRGGTAFFRNNPHLMIALRSEIESRGLRQWMGRWV